MAALATETTSTGGQQAHQCKVGTILHPGTFTFANLRSSHGLRAGHALSTRIRGAMARTFARSQRLRTFCQRVMALYSLQGNLFLGGGLKGTQKENNIFRGPRTEAI